MTLAISEETPLIRPATVSRMRWVRAAVRLFIGAAFVYAAVPKILHPHDFALTVYHYRILPAAAVNLVALTLPWLELTCGLAFAFGRKMRIPAMLLLLSMLALFAAALSVNLARDNNVECGCFSLGAAGSTSLAAALVRDAVLMVVILWSVLGLPSFTPIGSRARKRSLIASAIACCLLTPLLANAEPMAGSAQPEAQATTVRDYSDVESVQSVAGLLGQQIDILDLLRSSHAPRANVSLLQEVQDLVRERGFHTLGYSSMTALQLRHATTPLILHVRANQYSAEPDHFVVFAGIKENQAVIYTGPRSERLVPLPLLMSRWSGAALAVSSQPLHPLGNVTLILKQPATAMMATVAAGLAGLGCWRWWRAKPHQAMARKRVCVTSAIQAGSIVALAAALGFAGDTLLGERLLAHSGSAATTGQLAALDFVPKAEVRNVVLPEVNVDEARRLLTQGTLFVDARGPDAYREGHIPGAINVPSGSVEKVRLEISGLPKDKPLVVYCSGPGCGIAHYVASILKDEGYGDVSVFPGGWAKWPK